jgi:hypothetical protein
MFWTGTIHLCPKDQLSKFELVTLIAENCQRSDLQITPFAAPEAIDRTLKSVEPNKSRQIWLAAGFEDLPTIAELVAEI